VRGKWSRRQRLIVRTVVPSALFVLAVILFFVLKPSPEKYVPGERMEGLTETLARQLPSDYPRIQFVDVSEQAGIDFHHFQGTRSTQLPEDMGSGAAWGDYDNDGLLDLYVVNEAGPLTLSPDEVAASSAHNALYRNNGDGTFTEVSREAGVDYRGCGQAAAWGDADNDGFLDLCVTNYGEILLYHNNGDGSFTDISETAGIGGITGFWAGASWGDFDKDTDLDLYVCGYVKYRYDPSYTQATTRQYDTVIPASLNPSTFKPERNLLFRNNGNGTFSEVAEAAGVENTEGRSLSASWCDFTGDGWIDLYVANDVSDNALFRNLGDGTFEDISHTAWVADYRGAMGQAIGDWDGDGDMDLFITHWIAQENALFNNLGTELAAAESEQRGASLGFMDVADAEGLGQIALDYVGWGTAFVDYDNDGRLDLFVVNGSTMQDDARPELLVPMRSLLFWNRGSREGFFEVGEVSGDFFRQPRGARGLAVGDYDNDGDADAFVVANGGSAVLLRNDGESTNRWMKVRVRGRSSNRFGFGTKLRAAVDGQLQIREVGSASSYESQHAVGEEIFGLGRATQIDTLEVSWPSGMTQRFTNLSGNRTFVIVEGENPVALEEAGS
jgi:hypothetical protein